MIAFFKPNGYNSASIFTGGTATMKAKKILLFMLGAAVVVAGFLALQKRRK